MKKISRKGCIKKSQLKPRFHLQWQNRPLFYYVTLGRLIPPTQNNYFTFFFFFARRRRENASSHVYGQYCLSLSELGYDSQVVNWNNSDQNWNNANSLSLPLLSSDVNSLWQASKGGERRKKGKKIVWFSPRIPHPLFLHLPRRLDLKVPIKSIGTIQALVPLRIYYHF